MTTAAGTPDGPAEPADADVHESSALPSGPAPVTRRGLAKAARRRELLAAAARLMAERGFAGVRLEDIGAAVGVSGPAMYRHFTGKDAVLAEMLISISERLFDGGQSVVASTDGPDEALDGLIDFHIRFATTEPELIRVQDRDFSSLAAEASRAVRRLQRQYVELWADSLIQLDGSVPRQEARTRVQAVFGLINSSPRLPDLDARRQHVILARMAHAALLSS